MPMSVLAEEIYKVLQPLVPKHGATITYSGLIEALGPLPPPNQDPYPRDPRLSAALGEIVHACRAKQLPALAAIVIREKEKSPGPGYYPEAHPGITDEVEQQVAWSREAEEAQSTTYPTTL